MDLRKLKKLIDLVEESGIAELEITEGEEKVKIVKGGGISVSPAASGPPLAAILALLPLALAIGQGSAMQQPLAIAIISGLAIQLPLVLVVLPVLLATFERKKFP